MSSKGATASLSPTVAAAASYACSLHYIRLQPPRHTVAASTTYGCRRATATPSATSCARSWTMRRYTWRGGSTQRQTSRYVHYIVHYMVHYTVHYMVHYIVFYIVHYIGSTQRQTSRYVSSTSVVRQ